MNNCTGPMVNQLKKYLAHSQLTFMDWIAYRRGRYRCSSPSTKVLHDWPDPRLLERADRTEWWWCSPRSCRPGSAARRSSRSPMRLFRTGSSRSRRRRRLGRYLNVPSEPVWPDDGIKSCPNFPNFAPKEAKLLLHESFIIKNSPKIYQNFGATFVKIVSKKLKISPNLVILVRARTILIIVYTHT